MMAWADRINRRIFLRAPRLWCRYRGARLMMVTARAILYQEVVEGKKRMPRLQAALVFFYTLSLPEKDQPIRIRVMRGGDAGEAGAVQEIAQEKHDE
ncbi:TPA: hypothetical protein ACKP1E_000617 [Pseudomonas aeruginosa]|uniref:hypothetical protein n=1 Tax=Pseudomonas aeruginosa TaxID=287 RepID=UPI000FD38CCC|nr:hypothetical protein [Pseudomonas aeruginosa]MBH9015196.1 hypothetical protein [Pseudomonas aeruginosa]MBI8339380.1 hypothetical protein [Pseudomonas aeruginosa]MBN5535464.1 hypothetical protein [Pseudomonas aeruginosa]MCV4015570.1 hypothetical protein [Pseudomonas aeruginosa]MDV6693383.1 hypothetical protein [Pseudomonas aeruginosa]